MAAKIGNNYGEKLKTPAERRAAYEAYCAHIAAGYSGKSFSKPCIEDTIENMMAKYPAEFPPEMLEAARAEGRLFWEKIGIAGTTGKIKGFNPSSWIFNMKNRMGWKDRQEHSFDQNAPVVFTMKMGKDLLAPPAGKTKGKIAHHVQEEDQEDDE